MADDEQKVGVERLLFLRSLPTARPDGPEAVQIAAAMRDVHYRRGEPLFEIGEPSGDVFFLVKGSVRMTAPGAPDWDFEAPAIVGALDSFVGRPRTRRGVATSDTHALALSHADWLAVAEEHFDFAREAVQRLAGTVARMHLAIAGDGGFGEAKGDPVPRVTGLDLLARTLALRAIPVFHAAGVQAILRLAELCAEVDLGPGEALFVEGEGCETVDVVVSGEVAIERAEPPLRASFGPASLVGGIGTIAVERHAFRAIATEGAVVLRLRKDDVFDVMEDHFELTRAYFRAINVERSELMSRHGVFEGPALRTDGGRRT
jgi:CRP-like cAMP-binding protein